MKITENLYAFLWNNPTANNCNTFLINDDKKILIDPGHYQFIGNIDKSLSRLSLSFEDIDLVIVTHAHPDHSESVRAFPRGETLIAVHRSEADLIEGIAPRLLRNNRVSDSMIDIFLQEGELRAGKLSFQVIHSPGHSPGSICLYWPDRKALFSGDTVFNRGIGRTDLPGGSGQKLKESIKRISLLDLDYLLPGHGSIISGSDDIKRNFIDIERTWFRYI